MQRSTGSIEFNCASDCPVAQLQFERLETPDGYQSQINYLRSFNSLTSSEEVRAIFIAGRDPDEPADIEGWVYAATKSLPFANRYADYLQTQLDKASARFELREAMDAQHRKVCFRSCAGPLLKRTVSHDSGQPLKTTSYEVRCGDKPTRQAIEAYQASQPTPSGLHPMIRASLIRLMAAQAEFEARKILEG